MLGLSVPRGQPETVGNRKRHATGNCGRSIIVICLAGVKKNSKVLSIWKGANFLSQRVRRKANFFILHNSLFDLIRALDSSFKLNLRNNVVSPNPSDEELKPSIVLAFQLFRGSFFSPSPRCEKKNVEKVS